MIHKYSTLFDSKYLSKGIVLLKSLKEVASDAFTYVLCLDRFSHETISKLGLADRIFTLDLIDSEELRKANSNRTHQEYCWTLASYFTNWVREKENLDEITYLDADMMFFSSPESIFDEIGEAATGIIPHRFTPQKQYLEVNGKYNVSWVTFKGQMGAQILKDWSNKCLDWCYNKAEPERMGDQKYLDFWKKEYG